MRVSAAPNKSKKYWVGYIWAMGWRALVWNVVLTIVSWLVGVEWGLGVFSVALIGGVLDFILWPPKQGWKYEG